MALITISKNVGSGGTKIAELVAAGLGLELYDDNRLQSEALQSGVRADDLRHLDEKIPNLFDRILGANTELYLDVMESVVYDVSKRGKGVIMGHCSQMLLRDFNCALHVRVNAPYEKRIENLTRERGLNRAQAEKLIEKSDRQVNGFCKYAFNMNLEDPFLYDLILNTEKLSDETAAKHIMELAASNEIDACSISAVKSMEKLAQKKKVEAEILRNDISLYMLDVDVQENGRVSISGLSTSRLDAERIPEIVRSVPGVEDVKSSIVVANLM